MRTKKKNSTGLSIQVDKDTTYYFENDTLHLQKSMMMAQAATFAQKAPKAFRQVKKTNIIFNLDKLDDIDSAGVMALFYVQKQLEQTGKKVEINGGKENVAQKIELFTPEKWEKAESPKKKNLFEAVGSGVVDFFSSYLLSYLTLAANIFYWSAMDLFRSKIRRKGEFANQSVLIGVNAVLIVVFMSFVIGLVLALQSSQQLRNFGANIYIVDLVVIGMMSQMGPLITAILVAGRSGSAIAAEIATMKVTSELDALKTMGLDPVRFVVVPKMYACLFTMPFLIVLANVFGIMGGAVTAYFYLDITPEIFISRMEGVMKNKDLFTGLVKSQAYASLIVLTGSFYGFRVVRGAEGVGKVTTIAVVVAISLVILADSILGLLFY
jgi:phospholipid/cholesterol/gamma-HCH transport system permease protein